MTYAGKFLKAHGQSYTILRDPEVMSFISMRRSTRAIRDYGAREAHWEALTLKSTNLASGELFKVASDIFLVQSATSDPASGELALFAVKTNCTLEHKQLTEDVDDSYNLKQEWKTKNAGLHAFGEIVTAELRTRDLGLLQGTRYIFQVPRKSKIAIFDRVVYDGSNYRVDAVNDIGMAGVVRIQVSEDNRP